MKVIELFAGIGSQHQALKNLHIEHEVVAISEIDKYAVQSYTALHGEPNNLGDITKIKELPKADLWTYSFPCQDISVAGKQKGLTKDSGTRSGLLWEVERLLLKAKENGTMPKYLLLENVKNLVGKKHKANFDKWLDFLKSLGYMNYWKVLNAKDYGIPQNRERVFAVSILGGGYFKFPEKEPLGLRLKDMLEDKVDKKYYLSEEQIDNIKTKEKDISNTVRAGGRGSLDRHSWDIVIGSMQKNAYKGSIEGVCPALTEAMGMGGGQTPMIANNKIRKLTPKECWRLMGWKDEQIDKIKVSNSQMYKQAGNGIVVNVLEAIFSELFLKETNVDEIDSKNFIETNQIRMFDGEAI